MKTDAKKIEQAVLSILKQQRLPAGPLAARVMKMLGKKDEYRDLVEAVIEKMADRMLIWDDGNGFVINE